MWSATSSSTSLSIRMFYWCIPTTREQHLRLFDGKSVPLLLCNFFFSPPNAVDFLQSSASRFDLFINTMMSIVASTLIHTHTHTSLSTVDWPHTLIIRKPFPRQQIKRSACINYYLLAFPLLLCRGLTLSRQPKISLFSSFRTVLLLFSPFRFSLTIVARIHTHTQSIYSIGSHSPVVAVSDPHYIMYLWLRRHIHCSVK